MPSFQDISSILNHFVGVWFNYHVRFSLGDGQPGRNGVCTTAYSQAFCRTSSSPAGRCWPGSGWRRWRKVCDSLKSDLCFFLLLQSYKILHISKIIQTCSCQLAFFILFLNLSQSLCSATFAWLWHADMPPQQFFELTPTKPDSFICAFGRKDADICERPALLEWLCCDGIVYLFRSQERTANLFRIFLPGIVVWLSFSARNLYEKNWQSQTSWEILDCRMGCTKCQTAVQLVINRACIDYKGFVYVLYIIANCHRTV